MHKNPPSVQTTQTAITSTASASSLSSMTKDGADATLAMNLVMNIVTHFVRKVSCCPIFTMIEIISKAAY